MTGTADTGDHIDVGKLPLATHIEMTTPMRQKDSENLLEETEETQYNHKIHNRFYQSSADATSGRIRLRIGGIFASVFCCMTRYPSSQARACLSQGP
jgi:hypothetical protein